MPGSKNRVVIPYGECHKVSDGIEYKLCNKCFEWFPCNEEYFYKTNVKNRDGLFPNCKKCNIKSSIKNVKNNRERHLISLHKNNRRKETMEARKEISKKKRESGEYREWQRNNPDKVEKYNSRYSNKKHDITDKQWIFCKDYFKNQDGEYCCAYCGITETQAKEKYKQRLNKEHFDDDGANDLSNCIPSCKGCNSSKWKFEFNEWYIRQNFYCKEREIKIYQWIKLDYEKFI